MGKQSKRKKSKRQHTPTLTNSDTAPLAAAASNPILFKIRHGDPRIRHAALVALSSTVYDPTALSSSSHSDPELLRALSERLLDEDAPCAIIAAGCLSNYASFATNNENVKEDDELEVIGQVTIPIVTQRLSLGIDALSNLSAQWTESMEANVRSKLRAAMEEQWTLLSLSLQSLAGLIENCPAVLQRMDRGAVPLLLKAIECAVDGSVGKDEEEHSPVQEAAENGARALHSLLDENVELIQGMAAENVQTIVDQLTSAIGRVKSNTAKLHCCGAILSLRKVLLFLSSSVGDSSRDTASSATTATTAVQNTQLLQSCTTTLILPTLHSLLSIDTSHPKSLIFDMISRIQAISAQKQDEAMESEVSREVAKRKEPARLIARRLKEKKNMDDQQRQQQQQQQQSFNTATMEVDDKKCNLVQNDANDQSQSQQSQQQQHTVADPNDELEVIRLSWRNLIGSTKLALELMANLCSGNVIEEDEDEEGTTMMYDNENEHMWDSDDEAKLLLEGQGINGEGIAVTSSSSNSAVDKEVYESIASRQLVERILVFFHCWMTFVLQLGLGEDDTTTTCPDLVLEDINELLGICAVCLANMIACDIPTWTLPVSNEVVDTLCSGATVENGSGLVWWTLVSMLKAPDLVGNNDAMNHISTVMLALLRHQASARTLADEPTLDMLLKLLTQSTNSDTNSQEATIQMHCNIIAMLGVLCSEAHPVSINARVCTALTDKMRSAATATSSAADCKQSILVLNEVYNVLMDMYGGDDANDEVYSQQDVSGHLNRTLPMFKRGIKKVASVDRENEELSIWNETALNVSRFIRFKRGG